MPPENDNNMNVEDEPLHEGIISGGQSLLRSLSVNHNDEPPLAMDFVADGRIISSSNRQDSSGQIPEVSANQQSVNSTQILNESLYYPSPREIDQVSSAVVARQPSLEAATVEEPAGTLAETNRQALENSPAAASLVRDTTDDEEEEEEKREIEEEEKEEEIPPTFAVIPPDFSTEQATVLGEPARLFHDDYIDPWQQQAAAEDDAELTAMKRMAATAASYGGGCGGNCQCITTAVSNTNAASTTNNNSYSAAGSQVIELEPLDGEDVIDFYKRNRNFWTINAAEFLVSQEAALVSVASLKTQGMILAKDYFNAAKKERAAGVVVVAAATNAASRGQQSCTNDTTSGRTHFELGPLVGETVENFSSRTQHFWTMQAAESLALQDAAPVCVDTLNMESSRLAQEYWAMNHHQLILDHHQAIPNDLTQQATIVEITDEHDLHPLEMSHDAVRAEFVGQDFSRSSTNITALVTESSTQAVAVQGLAVDVDTSNQVDDMTTEATVIDSAPLAKEESQEAWRETEEAHVLEERDSITPFLDDRKPAAVDRAAVDHTEEFAVAEQEGEVLAIQEEIHPFEFIDEQEAEAHVVGQDYNYEPSAVITEDDHVSPALLTRDNIIAATATSEEGQGTEFHAVASPVRYNDNVQATEVHAVASPASPHEQNQVVDAHAVVSPAATDQGQETQVQGVSPRSLSTEQEQTREIHAVVVEEAPPTPTATPVATVSNPFEDDPNDTPAMSRDGLAALDAQYDDSWMRAPSLASQDVPPVAVRAPSEQSAWCLEDVSDNTHDDDLRGNPPPRSSSADVDENFDVFLRTSSASVGSEPTHSNRINQLHNLPGNIARSLSATGNVMEVLFGDTKAPFVGRKNRASQDEISNAVLPRTLLPWTVIYSDASRMWVVTIQCSQKALDRNHNKSEASKALRAFSLPTQQQAMCLGLAWTPPRMHPFEDNPLCHICGFRFAVFRRACHCRNCGVCICKDCHVQWPAKMVPDTYNTKKASAVNVCRSCDWLCNSFRLALLNGNMDEAVALHATGNINLTSPFNNVKGEIFYPVHAAALGASLELLRWLVDDHCCPIKSVRLSGLNNTSSDRYTPIVTSKGRSLLGIAMASGNVHMVRYLVVNKHLLIEAEKDITPAMVLRNFEKVLCLLPDTMGSDDTTGGPAGATSPERPAFISLVAGDYNDMSPIIPPSAPLFQDERTLSEEARDFGAILQHRPIMGDGENNGGENHDDDEECIICYDAKIDCVATPCGHQMCCLKCSSNFRPPKCPVCAQECSFMRVFR